METAKFFRVGFLTKLACLALVCAASVGCEEDPVMTMKRAGAELQRTDGGAVDGANFPAGTTDEVLAAVGKVITLTELNLANTQITDDGLKDLARLKNLEMLDLSNTGITDSGLKHLKKLTGLRELDLSATEVTGAGVAENLKDLALLRQLRMVKRPILEQPDVRSWKDAIRLGIDLKGGTNLIYQVDTDRAEGKNIDASIDKMVGAIIKRVNPSGTEEVVVRRIGSDRIEVIIPGVDTETVEEIKLKIVQLGSLAFEILANDRDHSTVISNARELPDTERNYYEGKRLVATWRDVGDGQVVEEHGSVASRAVKVGENSIRQFLVMVSPDDERVTGQNLMNAAEDIDQNGELAVAFTFDQRGTYLFTNLTSANRPDKDEFRRRLAIILDGKIHSAPNIRETIGQRGQISGNFSQKEIARLVDVLNAGALEIPLVPDPINELTISPLLGADVQKKGITAIVLASAAVVIFMLIYYRFAGIVANLCLLLNLILVMGTMALIQGTFTLPGLAGLVLTIGMAVDANVLIFERIREESARGSSLRLAIQNGFSRAFTTIVDANVTTLIVAVVLFMIGTDQVKGFAVTLFIGIVMSMFSALYCGRLVFDLFERRVRAKNLSMMSIVGSTEFDFIGKKSIAAICSAVLIICGMGSLFTRGAENLDIDFRGGSMVTFEFVEDQELSNVRKDLEALLGSGITIERIASTTENQSSDVGKRYRLRTTEDNVNEVRAKVAQAFEDSGRELNRVTLAFASLDPIPVPEKTEGDDAAPTPVSGFEGGHKTTLTLSSELTEVRVADYLKAAISQVTDEIADPASVFAVKGTKGSGTAKDALSTKPFSEFELSVRPAMAAETILAALENMQSTMASSPNFDEVNKFAKSVGSEMQSAALVAMLVSLAAIVAYIWFRFQRITFGLAAVAALVHDVLVVLGMVALASYASGNGLGSLLLLNDFKINLPMIAAFLTIVGYSLNDTIVVFDRIREVRGKNPALTNSMVNLSLNQTLARTLLTSFTTFIVVIILYIWGGEGIHGFAFCLVLGVLVGTYSSIYVASPVLLWLMNRSTETTQAAA